MSRTLDRRRLLGTGLALSGLALRPSAGAGAVRALLGPPGEGALVLLQLTGGNDGLSTVVPFEDPAYGRARDRTRIGEGEVLPVADGTGFHPALRGLAEELAEGRLAVVQGVGYPQPNRSHFASLGIWHAATPDLRAGGSGWIGRLAEVALAGGGPDGVVHVGHAAPASLASAARPAVTFVDEASYRFSANEEELMERAPGSGGNPALARVRRALADAARSSRSLREAAGSYATPVEYPRNALGSSLRTAAALLHGGVGCRVVSVEHTGYDTHVGQRRAHDRQMEELDGALSALALDLRRSEAGRSAVVLVFSEFGRRVAENASAGTDHGTAGPVFLWGARVKGGFHGAAPSLERLAGEDLAHTTDFRSVYAAVLEGVFGADAERVLGGRYPALDLIAPG